MNASRLFFHHHHLPFSSPRFFHFFEKKTSNFFSLCCCVNVALLWWNGRSSTTLYDDDDDDETHKRERAAWAEQKKKNIFLLKNFDNFSKNTGFHFSSKSVHSFVRLSQHTRRVALLLFWYLALFEPICQEVEREQELIEFYQNEALSAGCCVSSSSRNQVHLPWKIKSTQYIAWRPLECENNSWEWGREKEANK